MKKVDLSSWPRRAHYEFFRTFERPFFDVAARVDVTALANFARRTDRSLFATMLHTVLATANETEAFRLRFRDDQVFLVDSCHASFTFMGEQEIFNYATALFDEDLDRFSTRIKEAVEANKARRDVNLDDDHRLQLLYCTSLPWLDFQSISHAFSGDRNDCFPRIAWGRFTNVGTDKSPRFETTLQLTAHHALVDGRHMALFFENFKALLRCPPFQEE